VSCGSRAVRASSSAVDAATERARGRGVSGEGGKSTCGGGSSASRAHVSCTLLMYGQSCTRRMSPMGHALTPCSTQVRRSASCVECRMPLWLLNRHQSTPRPHPRRRAIVSLFGSSRAARLSRYPRAWLFTTDSCKAAPGFSAMEHAWRIPLGLIFKANPSQRMYSRRIPLGLCIQALVCVGVLRRHA
jgi:hypothetical protein